MITEIQKSRVGTGGLNLGTVQLWNELFVAGAVLGLVGCLAVCSLPMRCQQPHPRHDDSSHHHTLLDVPWGRVEWNWT